QAWWWRCEPTRCASPSMPSTTTPTWTGPLKCCPSLLALPALFLDGFVGMGRRGGADLGQAREQVEKPRPDNRHRRRDLDLAAVAQDRLQHRVRHLRRRNLAGNCGSLHS